MENIKRAILIAVICLIPFVCHAVKMTDFTEDTSPTSDDLIWTTNAPATAPADRKVTLGNLLLWMATQNWTFSGTVTLPVITLADASTLTLPAAVSAYDPGLFGCGTDGACTWVDPSSLLTSVDLSSVTISGGTASRMAEWDGSGNLTSSDTATTGTDAPVKANSPTFTDDITIAAAGVKLTGANGALTILGLGDGQDEDVKIDLNTTADTIIVSSPASSATAVSFSALNLITTGTVSAGIPIQADADGRNLTAAECYGYLHVATGNGTWLLPAAVAGMNLCVLVTGASDVIIDIDANDDITLNGSQDTNGDGITNATGSSSGDFVCLIAIDDDHWYVMGKQGTWTQQ